MKLYWSVTAYDRETHALIRDRNGRVVLPTPQGLKKNADGSVDIYFGPKLQPAKKRTGCRLALEGQFEVLFRLYGPEKPFFDKRWVLPDIEKIR